MGDASHLGQELSLVRWSLRLITLRRAWLPQHTTSSTFGDCFRPQLATHLAHSEAASLGAQKFPFAASFKMALSKAWSATSFFSWVFSFWRAFNSLPISGAIPPYF